MFRFPLLPVGLLFLVLLAAGAIAIMTAPAMALAADRDARWSPAQLSSVLAGEGYTDLTNLSVHDGVDTADATRWGVKLTGITIDPVSGEVLNAPLLTVAQVRTLLAAGGYTAVGDVRSASNEAGAVIEAEATRDGRTGTWSVDPWSGAVYPATDLY